MRLDFPCEAVHSVVRMVEKAAQGNKVMDQQVEREMPRYQSHKKVWALKIADVIGTKLTFADEGYDSIEVDPTMFVRYTPVVGDYYVVYDDGYKSISPAKAFEDGYTRV